MKIKHKFAFFFLTAIAILLSVLLYPFLIDSAIVNPKGIVAEKELQLIITALLLMLIVVIPVLLLTFFICLKYRASNKEARYDPNWDHSVIAECIWWGFPFVIIVILSIITWQSSHALDPFKPLKSDEKPLTIQVIALQWKWLFIYPEEKIASVNFFQFPEKTPINFEITADAPMNSFWIPQLGGQIYAMPGMNTKLHLMADEPGDFRGSSANLSGKGFAGMSFMAQSRSKEDFKKWVESVQKSTRELDSKEYDSLALPSEYLPQSFYRLKDNQLYQQIVMKYMAPVKEVSKITNESGKQNE